MSNYRETTIAGTSWVRCSTVIIQNELGETPSVVFSEQKAINLDGAQQIVQPMGSVRLGFDPAATLALVDPDTSLPTGETITHAEAYRILYSAYLQAAMARDAEEASG